MKHLYLFIFTFITADMLITSAMSVPATEYTNCEDTTAYFANKQMQTIVNPYIKFVYGTGTGVCPTGYTAIKTRPTFICGEYSGYSPYSGYADCFLYLDPQYEYGDDSGTYRYSGIDICEYEP